MKTFREVIFEAQQAELERKEQTVRNLDEALCSILLDEFDEHQAYLIL